MQINRRKIKGNKLKCICYWHFNWCSWNVYWTTVLYLYLMFLLLYIHNASKKEIGNILFLCHWYLIPSNNPFFYHLYIFLMIYLFNEPGFIWNLHSNCNKKSLQSPLISRQEINNTFWRKLAKTWIAGNLLRGHKRRKKNLYYYLDK